MARSSNPNSANSQFFICLEDAPHLDRNYTVFGKDIIPEALGRGDEAKAFKKEYREYTDHPHGEDLVGADALVNKGRKIIRLAGFNQVKPMLNEEELNLL